RVQDLRNSQGGVSRQTFKPAFGGAPMNQGTVFSVRESYWSKLCIVLILGGGSCLPAAQYEVIVERNVPATMRDGIVLRADIYRPKAGGKFPVLLNRTPYDKVGITAG